MNQSLEALMGSVRRALRDEILPELVSEHARSQLAGVLDVLGKIESMAVWSPDVTREQLELLDACLAQAAARIAGTGLAVPDITCHPDLNCHPDHHCHPGLDPGSTQALKQGHFSPPWIPDRVRDDSQFAHTQAGLEAALADAERRFAILTDWLFASPAGLPAEVSNELHELQRTTLRNTLKAQRRLVPSADFSSMTAPGQPAAAQGEPT